MTCTASILILHYKDDALTNQCVDSLVGQAIDANALIVVVDNGSPVPYVSSYPALVKVFRLERNLFLVPAFAEAMKTYPNEVYGLLNNDLICAPGMVAAVLREFEDVNVGIVAPGSSDMGAGVLYVPYAGAWGSVETAHVDNHCFWINHGLVEDIGYPEVEGHTHRACWAFNRLYCWKARQAGYRVVAALNAYVQHLHKGGYDAVADAAGQVWLRERLGEKVSEA